MSTHYDEKGKIFTNVVSTIRIPVTIQTLTNRIRGHIHTHPEQRIKDQLNKEETFLAVTDAVVYDQQGQEAYTSEFLALNRDAIVWVIPEDERG